MTLFQLLLVIAYVAIITWILWIYFVKREGHFDDMTTSESIIFVASIVIGIIGVIILLLIYGPGAIKWLGHFNFFSKKLW